MIDSKVLIYAVYLGIYILIIIGIGIYHGRKSKSMDDYLVAGQDQGFWSITGTMVATIPGIGITLAALIGTEIDGIERFPSPSKLCSYAGLVPSTHSSGGKTYHGKITSEGNKWIRWAWVESAVPASYADAEIKKRLDIFRKTKGSNVAKTAVARWLLKVIYHVLKERRPYVTAYGKTVEAGAAFYFT